MANPWQPEINGAEEAAKIFRANMSPRAMRLHELERWVVGSQYDHLPSWWSDGPVPLWDRAPCIVYPVVSIAISSNIDLVFGEGRFPTFTSSPAEDEESESGVEESVGLDEDDSSIVDRFLQRYHDLSQFRSFCRGTFSAAQGCGTSVGIHGVRNGKPFAELQLAKWCTPTLDADRRCTKLVITRPYIDTYRDPVERMWKMRVMLYRREIDAVSDVTMLPAPAREDGEEPTWTPDEKRTFAHGLGFCPVVWYPFQRGCDGVKDIDGHAIHERVTDEIHQHDIAISQRHRGALFSEPQICEIGVADSHNPTSSGVTPALPSSELGTKYADQRALDAAVSMGMTNGAYGAARAPARKKGPGHVWRYPDPQTKVETLTYPGDALKAQFDNATDLHQKLQEALAVVFLDPNNIKFAATTSDKALEAIKQRQVDRCNQYRDDLRDNFLIPTLEMQLRITRKLGASMTRIPGAQDVAAILDGFNADAPRSSKRPKQPDAA